MEGEKAETYNREAGAETQIIDDYSAGTTRHELNEGEPSLG